MKRIFLLPALAAIALSACDSPTGDDAQVVAVQVMPDERVLAVGETLALELVVRDENGESAGAGGVQWSTDNPSVAAVSPSGLVTGLSAGTATIRAQIDDVSGSVRVTVAAVPAACGTPGAVRSLAVGASVTLGGVQAATLCLDGAEGAEYLVVPFNAASPSATLDSVMLHTHGVVPVAAASPSLAPAPALSLSGEWEMDEAWHLRLQQRAARTLAPLVDEAIAAGRRGGPAGPSFTLDLQSPTLGQQVQVNTSSRDCQDTDIHTGRVAAIGERSIVLADVANPTAGLSDAEYASFAASFDTLVYPVVTQAFGAPGDVDANGRIVLFFTRAVNELTSPGSGAYVGGYFHSRDLFPTRARDGLSACAGSNYAEMFYLLAADPNGVVNGNSFSRELVLQTSLGTIAHELQHLVSASRRLYEVGTTHYQEEVWLNEGMSHIAEELVFYRASGLAPRQNISGGQISGSPRVTAAFRSYMDQNTRRYGSYLSSPERQSPYDYSGPDSDDLASRGAAWAFLRYAADRRGGSENDLWRALVDGSMTGLANLQRVLGTDPRPWVRDWTVASFTDDVVPGIDARFSQPSWRYRSLFLTYPLSTRRLPGPTTEIIELKSGSGSFVRFGVQPGAVATVTARDPDGSPLPSSIFLTVVRTK